MITVLFGGSRPEGNTAELTRYALDGLDYTGGCHSISI